MPNTALENDIVTVAVGVLRDPERRVLVTRRAPHAHQGGLWEFPGGKLEPGESVLEALARELWAWPTHGWLPDVENQSSYSNVITQPSVPQFETLA